MRAPTEVPYLASMTHITRYDESYEILVTARLFESGKFETFTDDVWKGALPIVNGDLHLGRRRHLAPIVSRGAIAQYESDLFGRVVDNGLAEMQAAADDGAVVRADLVPLVGGMLARIGAAITGIDDVVGDEARASTLFGLICQFTLGATARYSTRPPGEVVAQALEAIEGYSTGFYVPSLRRRQALVERYVSGDLSREELPDDFITRQLLPEGEAFWDDVTALRDTLVFLSGGLRTTALAAAYAVDLYYAWPDRDPTREEEPEYVRSIINETLRMRPPVNYIVRRATSDVTLESGRTIIEGEFVALAIDDANRDPEVFGADAHVFRPERYLDLPPQYPQYGLAFGAGPHLCIGKPVVAVGGTDPSETKIQRVLSHILMTCFRAGVRPDPENEPVKEHSYRPLLRTYPVVFTKLAVAEPA